MKSKALLISSLVLIFITALGGAAGCSSSSTTTATTGIITTSPGGTATATAAAIADSRGVVFWNDAVNYIGQTVTIFGPIIDMTSDAGLTILGMGVGVTEQGSVNIEIADEDFSRFPADLYVGKVVRIVGTIESDAANEVKVLLTDPSQVTVVP